MSADSPKRSTSRCAPTTVPPQAVVDRSLIDSVTGFLNDVTLSNQPHIDPKEAILWARFETNADISDPAHGSDWDSETGIPPPLLLILGYGTGVQVWAIPANGEAIEVLSWRHGSVRSLRILPQPDTYSAPIDHTDDYAIKRPLMAICDASTTTGTSLAQYCGVSFVSLRDGDQVKCIKFKNPVLDILANRSVVAISFLERIAVFDACTFEDRLTVTTCHPCPSLNTNPIALGSRWMAYAERKMLPSKRSSGGCDCDGVASYTATVLNAAKTLGKGLRDFGGQMAAGFGGGGSGASGNSGGGISSGSGSCGSSSSGTPEDYQPGIVTIIDTKYSVKETSPTTGMPISTNGTDPIVSHFVAHSDAIAGMKFNYSGMLLLTADRRGHDFHVFLILPNPCGPSLSAVHHLYVLHRGDTTAKVQDIEFSLDSRWVAVSTLRGTTHVFPITPYGGAISMRTHGSRQVVNRLSRFHRSAGLSVDGRSSSPVHSDSTHHIQNTYAYNNPRGPPFPRPTVVTPLAQLRQPTTLSGSQLSNNSPMSKSNSSGGGGGSSRQRLSSLSDEAAKPLRVCATFARARAWLLDPPGAARDIPSLRLQSKPVDSLFIMAGHGALLQYDLDVKAYANVPKDKICDDTSIDLDVEAKAQWMLLRKENSMEIQPPLPMESWLFKERFDDAYSDNDCTKETGDTIANWVSQVEIMTHDGPHRRLWMGPQFTFKTYNTPSGAPLMHIDSESVEIGIGSSTGNRPARSNPMNMPSHTTTGTTSGRPAAVPVLIESGSCSSYEQSPRLVDQYRHHEHLMGSDFSIGTGDSQLREDLADAMRESPGGYSRDSGKTTVCSLPTTSSSIATKQISAVSNTIAPATTSSSADVPVIISPRNVIVSIAKVVNPLGTVTTITESPTDMDLDHFGYSGNATDDDSLILENCDEALFRPVVAVYSSEADISALETTIEPEPPAAIGQELIVPVIEKAEADSRTAAAKKRLASKQENVGKVSDDLEKLSLKNKITDAKPIAAARTTIKSSADNQESESRKTLEKEEVTTVKINKESKDVEKSTIAESPPPTLTTKGKMKKEKSDEKPAKNERLEKKSSPPPSQAAAPPPSSIEIKQSKKSQKKSAKSVDQKRESTPPKKSDKDDVVDGSMISGESEKIEEFIAIRPKSRKKSIQQQPVPPPIDETVTFTIKQNTFADMMKASKESEITVDIPDLGFEKIVLKTSDTDDGSSVPPTPPPPALKVQPAVTKKLTKKQQKKPKDNFDELPINQETVSLFTPEVDVVSLEQEPDKIYVELKRKKNKPIKCVEETKKEVEIEIVKCNEERDTELPELEDFIEALPPLELPPEEFTEPDEEFKQILNEEIQASNDDCSRIQDALFRDNVPYKSKKAQSPDSEHGTPPPVQSSSLSSSSSSPSASTRRILQKLNLDNVKIISEAEFSDNSTLKMLEEQSNPHEPMIINLNDIEPDVPQEVRLIEFDTPVCDAASAPSLPGVGSSSSLSSSSGKCAAKHSSNRKQTPLQSQISVQQDSQDSDYKSLEFDIDETYLSLEPMVTKYCETSSSDDNTDESSRRCNQDEHHGCGLDEKQKEDDNKMMSIKSIETRDEVDEELQPLISSITSQADTSTATTAPLIDVNSVLQTSSGDKLLLSVDDDEHRRDVVTTDDEMQPIIDCVDVSTDIVTSTSAETSTMSMMDQDNIPELDVQEQQQLLQPQQVQSQHQQQQPQPNNNGKKKSKKKRR